MVPVFSGIRKKLEVISVDRGFMLQPVTDQSASASSCKQAVVYVVMDLWTSA